MMHAAISAMIATKDSMSIAAVADEPDLAFLLDHLRRRAGGDQRVESGQCAAGDRDEQEREEGAGEHRTVSLAGRRR